MDPAYRSLRCALPFCLHTRNFPVATAPESWLCYRHRDVMNVGLDYDVVIDPEYGEDAYIYSGVKYRVKARTATITVTFIGRFNLSRQGKAWRAIFVGEDGATLDVAKDAIVDIIAL